MASQKDTVYFKTYSMFTERWESVKDCMTLILSLFFGQDLK